MSDVEWVLPVYSGDLPPEPTAAQKLRSLPIEFCELCGAELSTHYVICNGRRDERLRDHGWADRWSVSGHGSAAEALEDT